MAHALNSKVAPVDAFSSDEALVAGLVAKEPRAWRELQTRYGRMVTRCIAKVTRRFSSRVSEEDVREIEATFMVSLFANDMHKVRSFDASRGHRFSSWLGMLAINCAYDHLRSVKREPLKEILGDDLDLASELPDPFEATASRERARIASESLAAFSEKDRTFAELYFVEGLEPEAVARVMNISVKTVYSKKHKIQARLEAALSQMAA
ncbi:MAG: sigma-70 family RNA polymerase sigma factor [Myxococcales bacterium]|nr:sigma-70 family RNA polymerase sigma factor [Myxococcales bacterium]